MNARRSLKDSARPITVDSNSAEARYTDDSEELAKLIAAEMAAFDSNRVDAKRIGVLGHMSASFVHEINQPVAAALINAQAALRFLAGPEPNLEEVRQALTRIAKLANWIAEVVGRSRALIKRVPSQKENFEINLAIRETLSLSQEVLVKNAVSVHTQFAQGMPLVRADRVEVKRVILNLITNAAEAMSRVPAGTRELRISTSQTHGGDILVVFQDSGPGLDAQNPDRLFDAFYTTKPGGLGIGLTICRSIIDAHNGRLWVTQTDPPGAAFQFTLPGSQMGDLERLEEGSAI